MTLVVERAANSGFVGRSTAAVLSGCYNSSFSDMDEDKASCATTKSSEHESGYFEDASDSEERRLRSAKSSIGWSSSAGSSSTRSRSCNTLAKAIHELDVRDSPASPDPPNDDDDDNLVEPDKMHLMHNDRDDLDNEIETENDERQRQGCDTYKESVHGDFENRLAKYPSDVKHIAAR
ncbi:hypothetical protein QAD02_014693 [Eretmocerus hayati]|uniref:Uncharacterized protein n=1 Tax=Eretmocerus hayati TaxID=131215 RepID=A0ACC2P648_9HYME|nr:hypothetical protein QAD02_014693 [Eretmocerus hayati]